MQTDFRHPPRLPPIFDAARAERALADLDSGAGLALAPGFRALLASAAGNSPYLARLFRDKPFLGALQDYGPDRAIDGAIAEALAVGREAESEAEAMRRLRVAKRHAALGLALADIGGLCELDGVMDALTRLADASVKGALQFLLRQAAARAGLAEKSGETLEAMTGLIVIAMGKHGAHELNYSSDIDLVVFYDEARFPFARKGDKRGAAVDLVKGLIRLLADVTADGYVFRVDLRLRPDAGATQIAISTEAAELYYESMGQNWERAAWIKARQCAGDPEAGVAFLKSMEPFVWRKNLDYAAIQDIHSIKRQIHAQEGHAQIAVAGHNIKLGRGGIREVEFFAQTQQLILGGRDSSLREPTTLGALAALHARGHILAEARNEMTEAYRFLRTLEHRLQMIDDQQTHTVPEAPDGVDHVARFMGYDDTAAFETALLAKLARVQQHYSHLFEREAPLASQAGSLVFTGVEDDPETLGTLGRMGFERASDIAAVIRGWHHGRIRATRSPRARELLTKLMPALLEALAKTADPRAAFSHFDRFLSGLPAGVQVFSLLLANPRLLDLLAEIAGSAPRLAEYLGRHPSVLDALIDQDFLTHSPDRKELTRRFDTELARVAGFEAALDAARRFANEGTFRIGVQVIQGIADAERAGPAYADVAETIVAGLHAAVEKEMHAAHGAVAGGGFAVVAQGKLGGREMTAGSDLDLVFLYTHDKDAGPTNGAKPLVPSAWFARAAQRFISALTAMTAEGRLYEVDMRLRPSGNQGPVAVQLDTFIDYHRTKSWTWERLALTRARVLAGPETLKGHVEAAIRAALTRSVPAVEIKRDAREMRERLAAQFKARDIWDIKYAAGGLIDIEFVAQALQLIHAPKNPAVLDQNTIAALDRLRDAGALGPTDAEALIASARLEHALTQVLRIALDGPFKASAATEGLKALLVRAAGQHDFASLEQRLAEAQTQVRAIFERLLG